MSRRLFLIVFLLAILPGLSVADLKVSLGNNKVRITLDGTDKELRLSIQAPSEFSTSVFALENPARIVVDALGIKLKSHKRKTSGKSKMLRGIRTAYHSQRVRIVLDLQGAIPPDYIVMDEGTSFLLTIGGTDDLGALKPSITEEAAIAPIVSPGILTPTPVPSVPPTIAPAPSATPTTSQPVPGATLAVSPFPSVFPSAVPSEKTSEPEQGPDRKVTGVSFETDGGGQSTLRVTLSAGADFNFSKEEDYYVLTLQECVPAGPHLLLPYYPPEGFQGITAVKGKENGRNFEISIFVDRSARLNAFRKGNEVWVKALLSRTIPQPVAAGTAVR